MAAFRYLCLLIITALAITACGEQKHPSLSKGVTPTPAASSRPLPASTPRRCTSSANASVTIGQLNGHISGNPVPVRAQVRRGEAISVHSYVTGEAVQFSNLDQRVLTLLCAEHVGGMSAETFTATADGLARISTTIKNCAHIACLYFLADVTVTG